MQQPSIIDRIRGYTIDRGLVVMLFIVAMVHAPLLLSDAALWDGLVIKNKVDESGPSAVFHFFRDLGMPQIGLLHMAVGSLPAYVFFYKLIAYACILGSAVCLYRLARMAPMLGDAEAAFIAALAMIYPFYSLWTELIVLPSSVCLFLFLFAAKTYAQRLDRPSLVSGWTWLAFVCFLLSFALESLLVFFYAVCLYFFLLAMGRLSLGNIVQFVRRHAVVLALPPVYFLGKRLLFPVAGRYVEYNQLRPAEMLSNLAKGLWANPKRIVVDQSFDAIRFITGNLPFFLLLVALLLPAMIASAYFARLLVSRRPDLRGLLVGLAFAAVLFVAAVFAYSAVGKFPVINKYECRHAILAAIPLAIAAVLVLRFALWRDAFYRGAVMVVLMLCGVLQMRNHILWQNRFIKYQGMVQTIAGQENQLTPVVLVWDQSRLGMAETFRSCELNWIFKQAFGNERHIGVDEVEFAERGQEVIEEALYQWNRADYMFREAPYPVTKEPFVFDEDVMQLEIHPAAAQFEPWVFLQYCCSGAEQRREFARLLVRPRFSNTRQRFELKPPTKWLGPS